MGRTKLDTFLQSHLAARSTPLCIHCTTGGAVGEPVGHVFGLAMTQGMYNLGGAIRGFFPLKKHAEDNSVLTERNHLGSIQILSADATHK